MDGLPLLKYEQREADIVLDALVRKTEVIQKQLGSAGQVIAQRIKDRLESVGINRGQAEALAKAIEQETDAERLVPARAEMDDDERAPLRAHLEGSAGAAELPLMGRIQMRETNYLQIATSSLHRTAGPYASTWADVFGKTATGHTADLLTSCTAIISADRSAPSSTAC